MDLIPPVEAIHVCLSDWETPFPELDVFGTDVPAEIAALIQAFARSELGSDVAGYVFCRSSVGSTHGVVLDDGRQVVIKARPPAKTNPDLALGEAALAEIVHVQRFLHDHGYPCPRPIRGPSKLGRGLATVETYLTAGTPRNAHQPQVRRLIVDSLLEHTQILVPLTNKVSAKHFAPPIDRLFPQPHSRLFAPENTGDAANWVLEMGRRARSAGEAVASDPTLGHHDLRAEHVRFEGDTIVATYDWDSLARRPEAQLVGTNAHGFTADWSQEGLRRVPTYDDIVGFIDDYEAARGRPFNPDERRATKAWAVYWIAYGAWISIQPGENDWPEDSWPALLENAGERLLHRV